MSDQERRDRFAAAALQGLMQRDGSEDALLLAVDESMVALAWEFADARVAARRILMAKPPIDHQRKQPQPPKGGHMAKTNREKLAHRILAEGEATGHAHRATAGTLYSEPDGSLTLDAADGATVTHEEHQAQALAPAEYRVARVREQDHAADEAREVWD